MDFALSPKAEDTCGRMWDFMRKHVFPAEPVYSQWLATNDPHGHPPVMEELKAEARKRGLWNLFLPELSATEQPRVRERRRDIGMVAGHRA